MTLPSGRSSSSEKVLSTSGVMRTQEADAGTLTTWVYARDQHSGSARVGNAHLGPLVGLQVGSTTEDHGRGPVVGGGKR